MDPGGPSASEWSSAGLPKVGPLLDIDPDDIPEANVRRANNSRATLDHNLAQGKHAGEVVWTGV